MIFHFPNPVDTLKKIIGTTQLPSGISFVCKMRSIVIFFLYSEVEDDTVRSLFSSMWSPNLWGRLILCPSIGQCFLQYLYRLLCREYYIFVNWSKVLAMNVPKLNTIITYFEFFIVKKSLTYALFCFRYRNL